MTSFFIKQKNKKNKNKKKCFKKQQKCSPKKEIEFGIEKCAMQIMRCGKWQMMEGIELPNQEKIRRLGEKETYKILGILEADTIKQAGMKEKKNLKKSISGEQENYSKPNYIVEISLKG